MGAMLVGIATGAAAMGFTFALIGFSAVSRVIIALIVLVKARRLNMKSGLWAALSLFLGLWIIPVYLIAKRKMALLKCTACAQQIEHGANYCISCGAPVKAFDEGAFLKKALLAAAVVYIIINAIGTVYCIVVS